MRLRTPHSGFIEGVEYRPLAPAWRGQFGEMSGFLVVAIRGHRYAYLVPPWVAGLFAAARARGRSVGRLYNRLVKGRPGVKLS